MNGKNPKPEQEHDDPLANFVDDLLDDETQAMPDIATHNPELASLQETARLLHTNFGKQQPDASMSARIRSNLVREWRNVNSDTDAVPFLRRTVDKLLGRNQGWQSSIKRRQRRAYTLGIAAVVILILLIVLPFTAPSGDPGQGLPGTAFGKGFPILPILLLGFVVLGGVLLWANRRR